MWIVSRRRKENEDEKNTMKKSMRNWHAHQVFEADRERAIYRTTHSHKLTKFHEQLKRIEREQYIEIKESKKHVLITSKKFADIEYDGLDWATMERQRDAVAVIHGGGGGGGRIWFLDCQRILENREVVGFSTLTSPWRLKRLRELYSCICGSKLINSNIIINR